MHCGTYQHLVMGVTESKTHGDATGTAQGEGSRWSIVGYPPATGGPGHRDYCAVTEWGRIEGKHLLATLPSGTLHYLEVVVSGSEVPIRGSAIVWPCDRAPHFAGVDLSTLPPCEGGETGPATSPAANAGWLHAFHQGLGTNLTSKSWLSSQRWHARLQLPLS